MSVAECEFKSSKRGRQKILIASSETFIEFTTDAFSSRHNTFTSIKANPTDYEVHTASMKLFK